MKISLVIPFYNEEKIIKETACDLCDALSSYCLGSGNEFEIIFSNDGSTDLSLDIIKESARAESGIKVVSYPDNRGKGSAVREGVLASSGDIVMYTDCDLAYGTDILISAAETLYGSDADVLIGSRKKHEDGYSGYGFLRRAASKIYMKILSLVSKVKVSDSQCGMKAFRKEAAEKIFSSAEENGWAFDLELLMLADRFGFRTEEIGVKIINHRGSHIKVLSDGIKMLSDVRKIKKRVKKINEK